MEAHTHVCAGQGFAFKNFFDSPRSDPAQVASEIERLRSVLEALFLRGHIIHVGFTQFMIGWLSNDGPFHIPASMSGACSDKVLGGPGSITSELSRRCMARMQCFTAMSLKVLTAEFPAWELLQSFSVFDLIHSHARRAGWLHPDSEGRRHAMVSSKLDRLAAYVGVDAADLQGQYAEVLPVAMSHADHASDMSNQEAWRRAVSGKTRQAWKRGLAPAHTPLHALHRVLERYISMTGCSTQPQEAAFSVQENIMPRRRNHMTPEGEEDELKVALDFDNSGFGSQSGPLCCQSERTTLVSITCVSRVCMVGLRVARDLSHAKAPKVQPNNRRGARPSCVGAALRQGP